MSYATYEDYLDVYHGTVLTAEQFTIYSDRASDYIDRITMGRAASYTDESNMLAKACCAGAEQYQMIDAVRASVTSAGGAISSESVGRHSVSYRSPAETIAELEKQLKLTVEGYLLNTGLLYRGVSNVHASYSYTDIS